MFLVNSHVVPVRYTRCCKLGATAEGTMAPANSGLRKVDIIATKLCMYVYVLFVYASKSKFCFVIKCMESVCIYKINQINKSIILFCK